MVSTCPSCKAQVTHEDYLFEVGCDCGMRFNPFYDASANSDAANPAAAAPEINETFTESNTAFKEIVDFGETLSEEPKPTSKKLPAPPPPAAKKQAAPAPASFAPSADGEKAIFLPSDRIEGYVIEEFYMPISTSVGIELEAPNPLKQAYDTLWNQCQAIGANAVVGVSWAFTPDGARCLVTGTPVRANKS